MASALTNEFHEFLSALIQYIDSNNYRYIYEIIFEIFYQAVYRKPFLLKNLYKDVRLFNVLQCARRFLDYVDEVVYKHDASIHLILQEILRRAYATLDEMSRSSSKYVILCDGLSVIDATYIVYRLRKERLQPFIAPLINPGGVTETYKLIFEPRTYFQSDRVTLNEIARDVAAKVDARGFIVLRDHDETIHRLRDAHSADIIGCMYESTSRLYGRITQLKSEFNGVVVLLSDHGYDVVEKGSDSYEVKHLWSPRSLSVIALILIV